MAAHPAPKDPPAILRTADVADALGISPAHARKIMAAGALPARKRGSRWYVVREALLDELRPERGAK